MNSDSLELRSLPAMDRLKNVFRPSSPAYANLDFHEDEDHDAEDMEADTEGSGGDQDPERAFSSLEYSIFLLLGMAMLWAWNMFLAAAPYFQRRFARSAWLTSHFQAAEISVASLTNVAAMLVLTAMQAHASYTRRIALSLFLYIICFTLLAVSTLVTVSPGAYFAFLMIMVAVTAGATGLIQNGLFSFVSGFGRSEYLQGIMTGQAIAGVLPALAQIITVAAVPEGDKVPQTVDDGASVDQDVSPKSAFIYFLAATGVSTAALLAFFYLLRRQNAARSKAAYEAASAAAAKAAADGPSQANSEFSNLVNTNIDILNTSNRTNHDRQHSLPLPESSDAKPSIPLATLARKLPLLSVTVFLCFAITLMVFPVFTVRIQSTSGISSALFIPLGFLAWNLGDLAGRLLTLLPSLSLTHYPFALFCLAMARLIFVPGYFLCNMAGREKMGVWGDLLYLVVVQGGFGVTNGFLGSQCMMGAPEWVAPEEREAVGGWMGLCLVAGLTVGSFASFAFGSV